MRYEVYIPDWVPPSYNLVRGRHWSAEHKLKAQTAQQLGIFKMCNCVPDATGRRRAAIVVTLAPGDSCRDLDNMDKIFLDALVRAHLLTDDSAAGLEGRLGVEFRRGESAGTLLILEDVSDG